MFLLVPDAVISTSGHPATRPRFDTVALWVLFSTWCSLSGWVLSVLGHLDRTGYVVSFILLAFLLFSFRHSLLFSVGAPVLHIRGATYSRRLLPKLWLVLLLLSLMGGMLFRPDNYDYLTYRFPRVLHWAWAHHWYWITTTNDRMNLSATGVEWLMTPLFIFFHTDRLFFLINLVSYTLLPGLIFSVFRSWGVGAVASWWCMWTLPAGLCYALQAGGAGNDMFAGVYLLAALHYASSWNGASWRNMVLSLLAIALLTGAKASNIPLVVPWAIAVLFNFRNLFRGWRPILFVITCLVAAIISTLPVLLLNLHFTGDYTGDPEDRHFVKVSSPIIGVMANSIEAITGNLSPPFWSHDISWNVIPHGLKTYLTNGYPRFEVSSVGLQVEETAGLSLFVTLFWLYALGLGVWQRMVGETTASRRFACCILAGMGVALIGYMGKMGSEAAPRLLAPYYLGVIGATLAVLPPCTSGIRGKMWKIFAYLAVLGVFPVLIFSPSRPLLSAEGTLTLLTMAGVPDSVRLRWQQNEVLRESRPDNLHYFRQSLPASATSVGCIGGGDNPGTSLWQPFGSREVRELMPQNLSRHDLEASNIHFVAVSETYLVNEYHLTLADLMSKWSMRIVSLQQVRFKTGRAPEMWYLLEAIRN